MTTTKNLKVILTSSGVPIIFSLLLVAMFYLNIPLFFLGANEKFTQGIGGSAVALLIVYVFLKIERKTWNDFYLTVEKKTLIRFINGSITGIALASCMLLVQVAYSGLNIRFTRDGFNDFLWMSLSLIPLAYMEELVFRSYSFFNFKATFGVWVAQFSIAILFALYHYIGGWSLYASFVGPFVWSFAFGLLALQSKGIALPTGFHFGLNFALAAIGSKQWIPGLFTIDFASTPTTAMLKSNEYFGLSMQLVMFVALILLTHRYIKNNHEDEGSN